MEFDWDPSKAATNIQKHRVAFEEAISENAPCTWNGNYEEALRLHQRQAGKAVQTGRISPHPHLSRRGCAAEAQPQDKDEEGCLEAGQFNLALTTRSGGDA